MNGKKDQIFIRLQPKIFTDTIRILSDEQRKWVRSTGFGSLLSFEMEKYPKSILKILVSSYDPDTSSLNIKEKNFIVTEDSVHKIIGLPRGSHLIQFVRNW